MPTINWEAKAKNAERQRAVAWARYYDATRNESQTAYTVVRYVSSAVPRNQEGNFERPTTLPPHITEELMDMAEKLNKEFSCPCCFDIMNKETIHISWCGHYVCEGCYRNLLQNENRKKSCPLCRKDI